MSSTISLSYDTSSVISLGSCCINVGLISGLIVLSIVMFGLGGILGGLLSVLWNKWRYSKGICHMQIFNNNLDMISPSYMIYSSPSTYSNYVRLEWASDKIIVLYMPGRIEYRYSM